MTERLSFGSGKEVMPYLKTEKGEQSLSIGLGLTEAGNMGHIVPGHNYILDLVRSSDQKREERGKGWIGIQGICFLSQNNEHS